MTPRLWLVFACLAGAGVFLVISGKRVLTLLRGETVELDLAPIGVDRYLAKPAAVAWKAMNAAAADQGVVLQVNSAWRSNDEQAELREAYESGERTAVVAPVGYSNHEAGRAVDVESAGGTNAAFRWLTANAARFGFARTVASEPWHWEHTA